MIVPDGIEPVEEWRTWTFDGKVLRSLTNGEEWKPGEALHAECRGGRSGDWEWTFVRYDGWTLATAVAHATAHNKRAYDRISRGMHFGTSAANPDYMSIPSVEPPPGYGYALARRTHETPREDCSCGIYAGRTPDDVPAGDVLGKVKMWGKIVPGTKGSRAEYAYPSELHVPAALADDPAILAYGVPVVVTDSEKVGGKSGFTFSMTTAGSFGASMAQASQSFASLSLAMKTPWYMRAWARWTPIGLNLAACALNLLVAFKVVKL